jgi:hypothetical protein
LQLVRDADARAERAEAERDVMREAWKKTRAALGPIHMCDVVSKTCPICIAVVAMDDAALQQTSPAATTERELSPLLDQFKSDLDLRLDNMLCGIKEGYDDSIVGFNEAWDVMRKAFDDFKARVGSGEG